MRRMQGDLELTILGDQKSGFAGRSIEGSLASSLHLLLRICIPSLPAPVAQLDRALPSEGRGREFESRRVRHLSNHGGPSSCTATVSSGIVPKRYLNFVAVAPAVQLHTTMRLSAACA
jgi:hypothetical protein